MLGSGPMVDRASGAVEHVVFLSGGRSSWAAAKRVADRHGTENLQLVFTDVLGEDASTYRFLIEGAADVVGQASEQIDHLAYRASKLVPFTSDQNLEKRKKALPQLAEEANEAIPQLHWLVEGRTVWDVFFDESYLGNTRADPCSRVLKREAAHDFVEDHFDPEDTVLYVGIDATEIHRMEGVWAAWEPYECKAPLIDPPPVAPEDLDGMIRERGMKPPDLYALGHNHSNCSGACVKQGHGGWALLLEKRPEVYAYWERKEQEFRAEHGDVAILRDRTREGILKWLGIDECDVEERVVGYELPDGQEDQAELFGGENIEPQRIVEEFTIDGEPLPNMRPLPLREFRQQIAAGERGDEVYDNMVGCRGCFLNYEGES